MESIFLCYFDKVSQLEDISKSINVALHLWCSHHAVAQKRCRSKQDRRHLPKRKVSVEISNGGSTITKFVKPVEVDFDTS